MFKVNAIKKQQQDIYLRIHTHQCSYTITKTNENKRNKRKAFEIQAQEAKSTLLCF